MEICVYNVIFFHLKLRYNSDDQMPQFRFSPPEAVSVRYQSASYVASNIIEATKVGDGADVIQFAKDAVVAGGLPGVTDLTDCSPDSSLASRQKGIFGFREAGSSTGSLAAILSIIGTPAPCCTPASP
jgi:hypothetical protein